MKKKIAVLANGWNNYSVSQALKGIRAYTEEKNIDVFLFLSFAAYGQSRERNFGEDAIFYLPDYKDFDGVIVFSAMLNSIETPLKIRDKLIKDNINAISIGMELEGLDYIGIDNYHGMYEVVSHLVNEHNIKHPVFFAGPRTNPDSNERIDATIKALSQKNIKLSDDDIYFTNWEYITSMELAKKIIISGEIPDAFICANDYIALAVCVALEKEGIFIPQDTIVTGFDRISNAETFYPSITTVYQDYEKIGYYAAKHVIEKMNGETSESTIKIESEVILNESCGCKSAELAEPTRRAFCCESYSKEMENIVFSEHSSNISSILSNCSSFKELKQSLGLFFQKDHQFEGDTFYFVIDENAKDSLSNDSIILKDNFSDSVDCIIAIEGGTFKDYGKFSTKELIPNYTKKELPSVFCFTSLHYDNNLYGYIVVDNPDERIQSTRLNNYMLQMNNNLEKYRQHTKLDEMNKALKQLSIRDPLTGLYNRFGLEQIGLPIFEDASKLMNKVAIVFSDINRMKYINDTFGHLQGDLAIRTVSSSILRKLPENWISIRYGGDEFIALGICSEEDFVQKFIEELDADLEEQVKSMVLSYPLTISTGYIITDPKKPTSLTEYINQADSIMYEHKQETYKKEKK